MSGVVGCGLKVGWLVGLLVGWLVSSVANSVGCIDRIVDGLRVESICMSPFGPFAFTVRPGRLVCCIFIGHGL